MNMVSARLPASKKRQGQVSGAVALCFIVCHRRLLPVVDLSSPRVDAIHRGRAERMAFASSFHQAYNFRLLFLPGSYFPIMVSPTPHLKRGIPQPYHAVSLCYCWGPCADSKFATYHWALVRTLPQCGVCSTLRQQSRLCQHHIRRDHW